MLRLSKKSKESALSTFAKRRPIATTMLCLGVFGLCLGGVTTGLVYGLKKDDAFTNYDNVTKIEDIWRESGNCFEPENFNKLLAAISGGTASYSDLSSLESAAEERKTAADLKANNQDGQKEIVVTFGGLDWTPTFLSKTADGKDTILTLWMTNSSQLNGQTIYGTTKFNSNGQSKWSSGWYKGAPEYTYPSNMYGTSYIRAVTLNNGGKYANSDTSGKVSSEDEVYITTVEQDPNSVFAKFTMDDVEGSLTDYIVEPARVQWQEYGQEAKSQLGLLYSAPNENWSDQIPNSGAYMGTTYNFSSYNGASYNYAGKGEDNYIWRDDKIWLPSLTETDYSDTKIGLWNTSTTQRQNSTSSWLRSGFFNAANNAFFLNSSGANRDYSSVTHSYGVRVALHLSLTAAAKSAAEAPPPTWADITTATSFAGGTGEESAPYEIATAEQLALLAKRVNDPNTHDQYASKYYIQTANIRLGGHDWQPIGIGVGFQGHYDGQNYKIEGISAGLFSSLVDSYVTNTIIASGFIKDGYAAAGIAYASTRSTLTNCKNYASIEGQYYAGGIICMFDIGTIKNCVNYGNVVATGDGLSGNANYAFAGGIAGTSNGGGQTSIIENCINYGDVTSEVVGGIAGGLYQAEIRNCISNCSLTAVDSTKDLGFAGGGILGATSDGCKLTNCAVYGYVNVKNFGEYFGCLVGSTNSADIITGCSFNGTCNTNNIKPFYGMTAGTPQMSACYACINSDVKYYSDTDSDWAEHYGLAGSMNDGLPMQRELFAIASVSPATTDDILAAFPADKGWEKYETA